LQNQVKKLERLRKEVRELTFIPVEPAGYYSSIAYKSFDGGMFRLYLEPLEIDLIDVADSNGNVKLNFVAPVSEMKEGINEKIDFSNIEKISEINKLLQILGVTRLADASEILKDPGTLMEIAEFACIFDKLTTVSKDEKTLIMKDGFLRTKKIKAELLKVLKQIIQANKKHVKLVGVTKTSKIVSLLSTALFLEKKIPSNKIGYIEIPLHLELETYDWSGSGRINPERNQPLNYAFGSLYIAKLSRLSNILVTVEIPNVYSKEDVTEIISYLAKDSMYSYPVLGYPQTIMRAHEAAVRIGLPASIVKDKIFERIRELSDPETRVFLRDGWTFRDIVDKGVLGGER
jgi:hypothetical protein